MLRLIHMSLDGLTAFTTWPLRAVSALGYCLALPSIGYGGYLTVVNLLYGGSSSFRVDCHNVIVQPPGRMETAANA